MTSAAKKILESFDELQESEKREVATAILRRVLRFDSQPLTDGGLVAEADDLFRELDTREASDEISERKCQVASLGAFFGTPRFAEKAVAATRRKFALEALKPLLKETDSVISKLIETPTVDEFIRQRNAVFPSYANIVLAVSRVVFSVIPSMENGLEHSQESLTEIAEKFEKQGAKKFSPEALGEIAFLISTAKKTNVLAREINKKKLQQSKKEKDAKLRHDYSFYALWAQLHFDCLGAALHRRKQLDDSILSQILEGFRAGIMAYSCARQALELRGSESNYSDTEPISWDEEDEALANF